MWRGRLIHWHCSCTISFIWQSLWILCNSLRRTACCKLAITCMIAISVIISIQSIQKSKKRKSRFTIYVNKDRELYLDPMNTNSLMQVLINNQLTLENSKFLPCCSFNLRAQNFLHTLSNKQWYQKGGRTDMQPHNQMLGKTRIET